MKSGKIETAFPPVNMSENQMHHFEVYRNINMLLARAAEKIGEPCCFSFLMKENEGNQKHVFLIRQKTAEKLGLPFNKFESDCPWQVHAYVAKHLAKLISDKK